MFDFVLQWKEFDVYLPDLEAWMKEQSTDYKGCSANTVLIFHFSSEPSEELKSVIMDHYESLTESGQLERFAHEQALNEAEQMAMEAIISLSWDDMIPAERKLMMNRPLTLNDKEELLVKYPSGE